MINRYFKEGEKLDVAGLNQIIVLLDRSETVKTEIALNIWPPNLDGPPHKHDEKEQIFYFTSGKGIREPGSINVSIYSPVCVINVPDGI